MASRGWGKNKKGFMVNSEGKTARQVKQEKYAAKKADAKAKSSGGGGGGGADDDFDFAGLEEAVKSQPKKRGLIKQKPKYESTPEEKAMADDFFGKEGRAARKGKMKEADNLMKENTKKPISTKTEGKKEDRKKGGMLEYSDVGTLKQIYQDEMSIKNPKKFNEAKLNEAAELIKKAGWNYDAVVLKETGPDRYEVIGNAFVYEAAKRAGLERINTVIGNDKAEQNLKASRDDEPETLTVGPKKDRASKRYDMEESDIGAMKSIYLDEIDKPTQRVNPKKVAEAAERMKQGTTNWEPIPIRETGRDRYEIVGNAHLYEAAKQAGLERMKTIMVGDQTKEHKLGGKSKRKR